MDSRYFLVYSILTSCLVAGQTPKYALVGQSIMFNADITTPPDQILWKHDGNKVVEFDGKQERLFGSYFNRVILDWLSADLEIDQLRYEDSGIYELEVFTKTVLDRSSYKLEVIDKVPEPTITCEMKKGSSSDESGNQATLTCSAELGQSPSLTKFQWSSNGNVQSGRNLTISLGDEHDNEVYTCTVSNPLTKESAVFTAKECYSDKDSSTTLIVCILIPILLVGLAILIFILWRKGLFSKKREEDLEKPADEIKGNHGFNGDEGRPLLDRAPTMPSHQPLHFVPRNNDPVALEQDTEEGQDKTPQKGFVKNFVSKFEETPRHIPAGSQKNKHSDRRLLSPSSVDHSEISDGQHKDAKESFREELDDQSKLEAGVSARPPPPPKRPSVQNRAGKDKKLTDEDKSHEAEEEKDIKSDPSGSKKADDSLSGKLEAGVSARPPPPPKRPSVQNRAGKDKKLTDEDESHEAEEEKDIKSDPSDSKKADDSLSGQDKTPQKGFIKNFLSKIEETPRHIPAGSQKNKHSDRSLSSPSSVDHSEISDGEHKDAKESFQEELDDQSKLEAGVSARPPPPPKRPSVQNRAGKDKKLTDEDESHEAEEEKDIKSDPSDSKKADDSLSGKLEAGVSARPPPPPKRPSVPNRAGKDKKLTDEDESHEAEEEKDIKSDPSESKKADDSLSGKLEAGVSARPPPPPKRPSVPNRAGKDKKLTDEDESHEAEEEKDIESDPSDSKKADDSLSGKLEAGVSARPPPPPKRPSVQNRAGKDKKLTDEDKSHEAEEEKDIKSDPSDSKKADDSLSGKLEAGVSARPPPPPKRPSVQNRAGKDKKLTDEDGSHEAEEEKDIESDPSDSKKADDSLSGQDKTPQKGIVKDFLSKIEETPRHIPAGSQKNKHSDRRLLSPSYVDHSEISDGEHKDAKESFREELDDQSKLEAGVSARPPPPPKRPSVQNRAGKDKKLTDEDGSHEAEEEKDIESDPSDSKKADDSLSECDQEGDKDEDAEI
ncbi:uncharacterized protein LOC142396608 isoform X4 [Odontesthes bonariensis]|uniref:uncharacterized protein LOC142396608 isoform X4 n=1 Tax=Odontesthes bonariensis TaxID=219752 RepID=UPI003F58101D